MRSNSERRAAQRSQVVVCRPRQRKNTKNIFILHTRTLIIQKRAQSLIYSCPLSILFVVVSTRICPVDVSGRVCTYVSVQCPVCPLWTGSLSMALKKIYASAITHVKTLQSIAGMHRRMQALDTTLYTRNTRNTQRMKINIYF